MVYKIECSWCGLKMGTKEGASSEFAVKMKKKGFPVVSHSICPKCRETVENSYKLKLNGGKNGMV